MRKAFDGEDPANGSGSGIHHSRDHGDSGEIPQPLRGRFKLVPAGPHGAILGWATDLCDRCLTCECGVQREPLDLTPGGAVKTFQRLRAMQKDGIG